MAEKSASSPNRCEEIRQQSGIPVRRAMPEFELNNYLGSLQLLHDHVCPRQILGLRMGIYGARLLELDVPRPDKRLFAFVETDGCFADGVAVATGCALGHRTMRLMDFGKVAVTFVDVKTNRAIRLAPRPGVRELAQQYAPNAQSRWHVQLEGYQLIPDKDLIAPQAVRLNISLEALISKPGCRAICEVCGEEIINEREVVHAGTTLCRACAGETYYQAFILSITDNLGRPL
jgi:formylmethanofuran dehydrogenase subunit E